MNAGEVTGRDELSSSCFRTLPDGGFIFGHRRGLSIAIDEDSLRMKAHIRVLEANRRHNCENSQTECAFFACEDRLLAYLISNATGVPTMAPIYHPDLDCHRLQVPLPTRSSALLSRSDPRV